MCRGDDRGPRLRAREQARRSPRISAAKRAVERPIFLPVIGVERMPVRGRDKNYKFRFPVRSWSSRRIVYTYVVVGLATAVVLRCQHQVEGRLQVSKTLLVDGCCRSSSGALPKTTEVVTRTVVLE